MAANPAVRSVNKGLRIDRGITGMMLATVDFEPTVGIVAAKIDRLGMDIRSFREPLTRSIKEVMIPSFRKNFDAGGRPSWEPLSDSTLEIRSRLGTGTQMLKQSGRLEKAATSFNIWKVSTTSAIILRLPERVWYGKLHQAGYGGSGGSKSMKARLNQFGGDAKKALDSLLDEQWDAMANGKKMKSAGAAPIPARPFILIQDEDEDEIAEVFTQWLEERVERHLGRTGKIGGI
jgi:phage gpG-like protein